ncbi:DUF6503 family protein [Winogradskyella sp.]|uniref:DUF6503 family protein n=1 Tax=Winogradskyella sp. TaxID=1883156 RepID=UPI003F6CE977
MKNILFASFLFLLLAACKSDTKEKTTVIETLSKEDITTSLYPESITKVFKAHGGIDRWNKMHTLSFTMERPNGKEVTTTHLKTRAELIDASTYSLGFDGSTLWINEKDGNEYKGNAGFYKGLMMYFYAMPFIVGDNGVLYENTEPLIFNDKSYPGILISYEDGVGVSSDDQYIIYYDEESGQMQWLAYTVTYGKEEKSNDFHFIKYSEWLSVNGLLLPKTIEWYKYENNLPTEKRNTVEFTNIILSEEAPKPSLFKMQEGAYQIK